MYAVVGNVSIQTGHEDEAGEFLKSKVLPMVKQAPGNIAGYWLDSQEGHALGITLWESEEAARGAAQMAQNAPRPDFITFNSFEVRGVVAQV